MFTDHDSGQDNAIGRVRPSSVQLTTDFDLLTVMGYDHSSLWTESPGRIGQDQRLLQKSCILTSI